MSPVIMQFSSLGFKCSPEYRVLEHTEFFL